MPFKEVVSVNTVNWHFWILSRRVTKKYIVPRELSVHGVLVCAIRLGRKLQLQHRGCAG